MATIEATALADLLDDLMAWLRENPNKDLSEFAEDHDCSVEDISDAWNTYFSADFSRDYDIDVDNHGHGYHPATPPHGDPEALKSYLVHEVNTYQEYTTINNIEDNSFNQQIIADGNVNQDIDIDNRDVTTGENGVVIQDSRVDDTNVVTGDDNVVDSEDVLDGDVRVSADDGGQAQSGINFGDGTLQQNQQDQDVTVSGDNTSGDTGSADGEGGDGDGGRGIGTGGAGGDGDDGGDVNGFIPIASDGGDSEGGDGGLGRGVGGSGDGGRGDGGESGESGDAGHDVDVSQSAPTF